MRDSSSAASDSARVHELILELGLARHPEGGWYREVHRSTVDVHREPDGAQRSALTTIFFLLAAGEVSRWHRVAGGDEAWHFYEGEPLELLGVDVWCDAKGMAEHYADPNEMKALEGAFSGAPDATVWNQAPGNWSEW